MPLYANTPEIARLRGELSIATARLGLAKGYENIIARANEVDALTTALIVAAQEAVKNA